MLTIDEALKAILDSVEPFPAEFVKLHQSLGLALAETIHTTADSPPFDKALMDGFAVRSVDVPEGNARLKVLEVITAGRVPTVSLEAGDCVQIMTGAPLPEGADAVVRVEDTNLDETNQQVEISTSPVTRGTNVLFQGESSRKGAEIVQAGETLRPQEIGALAEMGVYQVPVRRRPKVAVLATGDELVTIDKTPGPGQIRNSNEVMLAAQLQKAGAEPLTLGIVRDDRKDLRERIQIGLQSDVLLLSGGVSAGKLDFVPSELQAAGVEQVFHKIQLKPGKPLWFGIKQKSNGEQTAVFGLPGNPVSSMVCFTLFVQTALRQLMGVQPVLQQPMQARLEQAHLAKGDRPTYHPAAITWTKTGPQVQPINWQGSADLQSTVRATGLAYFPPGDRNYQAGEFIDVIPW